jgi:hypothetical protein
VQHFAAWYGARFGSDDLAPTLLARALPGSDGNVTKLVRVWLPDWVQIELSGEEAVCTLR